MLGPGRQRQIRVAPALGKILWNPLGQSRPAHPPIIPMQNGQDFWSNSREEGGGGNEFSEEGSRRRVVEQGAKYKEVSFLEHILHAIHLTS